MRTFIAVDIDKKNLASLEKLQNELRSKADVKKGDIKWVEPENIHLTLKFLGEVDEEKMSEVYAICEQVGWLYNSFELSIESVGYFGGRSATVLWVGSAQGTEKLLELQKTLEQKLAEAGFPPEERPFSVHLTLARIKNPKAGFKIAQLTNQYKNFKLGVNAINSINVYKSQLTPNGSIYTLLGNYKLK